MTLPVCSECGQRLPSTREPLTKRQREVWEFIRDFQKEHSYVPSYGEIAAWGGNRSLASVWEILSEIERRGWLKKGPKGSFRSLVLLGE